MGGRRTGVRPRPTAFGGAILRADLTMSMRPLAPLLVLALLLTPLAVASEPVRTDSTWTVFTTVQADVRDNYAVVKVIADIRNQGPDPEFPFVVRVPDDAFVTGLTITRDGTTFEAEIKDREAAREEYEAWKAQEQTGGLVEKARRTSVYSYLINVAEFTSVTAVLTYERYLAADRGVYNLSLEAPVSGFGQDLGAQFIVTVRDSDGVLSLWGEPGGSRDSCVRPAVHPPIADASNARTVCYGVGPRPGVEHPTPFSASYILAPTADAGSLLTTVVDGKGYFAHRFRAPADAEQLPMDLVMVLDVSGSMGGMKLQQMIDASKQVVAALDEDDRLHIVAFSSDARSSWSGLLPMTPENRTRAVREVQALFDGGGTNIEAGLRRGFAGFAGVDWARSEERFPALVLLTDGQPTAGVTSRTELRSIAASLNERGIPVFGIAFGDDADWTLVRALAQDGEGAAVRVPPGAGAEVDLRRFMALLTTPILRDVAISYGPGVEAHHTGARTLFAGSELLVVGTYDPARGIRGDVTGWSSEGARRYTFGGGEPGDLPFLPRLVAYHEVRALQEQEDAEGPTGATTARIKELALRHGFVTDHTSLVVTLPQRDLRGGLAAEGDARLFANDGSGPHANSCPGCTSVSTTGGGNSGGGWWPFGGRSAESSSDAMQSAGGAHGTPTAHGEAPEAQVPSPGVALVALALAAAALLAARRRG